MRTQLRPALRILGAICGLAVSGLGAAPLPAAPPGRWESIGPPAAPLAGRLVFGEPGSNRVFALNEAGLWRSRLTGGSWRSLQVEFDRPVLALAADPRSPARLWAITQQPDYSATLHRSDDAGEHWTRLADHELYGYVSTYDPVDLVVDRHRPDTLYWLAGLSIVRSVDGGRTFDCFAMDRCGGLINEATSIAFAPDDPQTIYVGGPYDFTFTHDGGQTWTHSGRSLGALDALVATAAPRALFAWSREPYYRGGDSSCFVRSDDDGATWRSRLAHSECGQPAIDPDVPGSIRVVVRSTSGFALWASLDGGDHWRSAGAVPARGDLYPEPGGGSGLYLVTESGVFRAASDAGPWRPANRGFVASQIAGLATGLAAGGSLYALQAQPYIYPEPLHEPLLRTTDGGRDWQPLELANPIALAVDPHDPTHVAASAVRYDEGGVFRYRLLDSHDGGRTWKGLIPAEAPHSLLRKVAFHPGIPNVLFGSVYAIGMVRSLDGGRTWLGANAGLHLGRCTYHYCDPNDMDALLGDPRDADRLYLLLNGEVYTSTDQGSIWSSRSRGLPRRGVQALAIDDAGTLYAVTGFYSPAAGWSWSLSRSLDAGDTWVAVGRLVPASALSTIRAITGFVVSPAGLFVATDTAGVLRSTDGGRRWQRVNAGLPATGVAHLLADARDPRRLYLTVASRGVYSAIFE